MDCTDDASFNGMPKFEEEGVNMLEVGS